MDGIFFIERCIKYLKKKRKAEKQDKASYKRQLNLNKIMHHFMESAKSVMLSRFTFKTRFLNRASKSSTAKSLSKLVSN